MYEDVRFKSHMDLQSAVACLPRNSSIAFCHRAHASRGLLFHRGIGGSTIYPHFWEYSTDGFAADALALLEHLGWERTHLIGMSLGGKLSGIFGLFEGSKERAPASAKRWRCMDLDLRLTLILLAKDMA